MRKPADTGRTRDKKYSYVFTFRRAAQLVWRASPPLVIASLVLTVAAAVQPLASIYINSQLFGLMAKAAALDAAGPNVWRDAASLLGWLTVSIAAGSVLNHLTELVQRLLQRKTADYVNGLVLEKVAYLDFECFEDPAIQEEMRRATNEAPLRPLAIVKQVTQALSAMVTSVGALAVLILWRPWCVPFLMISPFLLLLVTAKLSREQLELADEKTEMDREANYLRSVVTGTTVAKEIRIFGMQDFLLSRIRRLWDAQYFLELSYIKRRFWNRSTLGTFLSIDRPAFIGYVAYELLTHQISITSFTLYTQTGNTFQANLRSLTNSICQLYEGHLFIGRLFDFLSREPVLERPSSAPARLRRRSERAPTLTFEAVSFRYPLSDRLVLRELSFELRPGETIGLVGLNGSGKSTVVKLISGLYTPSSGQILLDGVDTRGMDRSEIRRYIGLMLQDFAIYQFSVRDNIAVGRLQPTPTPAETESAALGAGLGPVIATLPHQFETIMGRGINGSHEFSGGQRQLLAFSRTRLRNAPILVLDEPTSSLDASNERNLLNGIFSERRSYQYSNLLITHRLSAVRHADRVFFMEGGAITEAGTHDELIELGRGYSSLYQSHSAKYRSEATV